MEEKLHSRYVLMNYLHSESRSRAPQEHKAPTHSGEELLQLLQAEAKASRAIEFFDSDSKDSDDHVQRMKAGEGHNFIRLKKVDFIAREEKRYAVILVDAVDHSIKSMPVIDYIKMVGRDIAGDVNERGSFAAHLVVRLPLPGEYDIGEYRCVIESVPGVSRRAVRDLFSRQLRRIAKAADFGFNVMEDDKKGRPKTKRYVYRPRFIFAADVGRSIGGAAAELSHMTFTKRSTKAYPAEATDVRQEELVGDIEIKISAKHGPKDTAERGDWMKGVRKRFEGLGYKTRVYFQSLGGGGKVGGGIHQSLESAADILLCPRETIQTAAEPRKWVDDIQLDVRDAMIALLDRDELWERSSK